MIDGLNGTDWDAKPCPVCGGNPRIHMHKFTETVEVNGRKRTRVRTKCYYDCPCGECITDWVDSEYNERFQIVRHARDIVKEIWSQGKFL